MKLFDRKEAHSNDADDAIRLLDDKTPFAVSEAFKSLYTKVLYLPMNDKCKKIAVTSAESGEAKTYVSCNLAITLAANSPEKRVLLIDLDMRKPRIARLIKKYIAGDTTGGLSEYLAGIDATPNFVKTTMPNFDILLSGKESSNPIGLINSSRMNELIALCNEQYDYVIIDSPPVGLVADAVLLSNKVNGYLIAARADYTNINSLSGVVDSLKAVGGEVFGVVLSAVNPKKTKTGSYKGSAYY